MTLAAADVACPVCRATGDDPCRAVDFLPLPSNHGERTTGTPMYDELVSGAS